VDNSTNINKYKRLAPFYDMLMGSKIFLGPRQRGIKMLELQPGEKVLLVGVGTGLDLPLLPSYVHITGIDISKDMLARANKQMQGRKINLEQMNAEQLAYNDETFDVVILSLILSVVENPQEVLAEALRVIKDTGRILVFDKFLADSKDASNGRKMLNLVAVWLGTDINRRFLDILGSSPAKIIKDLSTLGGTYRIIILEKFD